MAYFYLDDKKYEKISDIFDRSSEQRTSTKRANFCLAEKSIRQLYKINGQDTPSRFYFAESPIEAAIVCALMYPIKDRFITRILQDQFWFSQRIYNEYLDRCESLLREVSDLYARLDNHKLPFSLPRLDIGTEAFKSVCEKISLKLPLEALERDLRFPDSDFASHIKFANNSNYGSYWDHCWQVLDALRQVGFKFTSEENLKLDLIKNIADNCWETYYYENIVVICDRPAKSYIGSYRPLERSELAVQFSDGSSLFYFHGNVVSQFFDINPEKITMEKIKTQNNQAIQRAMFERISIDRLISPPDAITIDQDCDNLGNPRALYKVQIGDATRYAIEVTDSSKTLGDDAKWVNKKYLIEINPNHYGGRAGQECQAAIASTWRHGYNNRVLLFASPEDYRLTMET